MNNTPPAADLVLCSTVAVHCLTAAPRYSGTILSGLMWAVRREADEDEVRALHRAFRMAVLRVDTECAPIEHVIPLVGGRTARVIEEESTKVCEALLSHLAKHPAAREDVASLDGIKWKKAAFDLYGEPDTEDG